MFLFTRSQPHSLRGLLLKMFILAFVYCIRLSVVWMLDCIRKHSFRGFLSQHRIAFYFLKYIIGTHIYTQTHHIQFGRNVQLDFIRIFRPDFKVEHEKLYYNVWLITHTLINCCEMDEE